MNGPAVLYRLKPVFNLPEQLELPTCMYRMKNPVAVVTRNNNRKETDKGVLDSIMDKVKELQKAPVPEIEDLERRWTLILKLLDDIKSEIGTIFHTSVAGKIPEVSVLDTSSTINLKVLQGAVINANPSNPPYSLLLIKNLYKSSLPIDITTHVHSSLAKPPSVNVHFSTSTDDNEDGLNLKLIWTAGVLDTELVINPIKQLPIRGEVNILRYLGRSGLSLLQYPSKKIIETVQIDAILDTCHRLLHVQTSKEKESLYKSLNEKLKKSCYFGGEVINICDMFAWSAMKQVGVNIKHDLSPNLAKWYTTMNKILSL